MKRRFNITMRPKHLLIICVTACVGMILVSFFFSEQLNPVKTAFGEVVTPMQSGIDVVGDWIRDKKDMLTTVAELQEQNKELQEKVDTLSSENKILKLDQYELDSLRELYELDKTYSEYPKVAARVTSLPSDNWYNEFHIDKGTNDGLEVGMNVMAGDGLVGIIIETGHNYSVVRSIIDDISSVGGMVLDSNDTCTVSGSLELIDEDAILLEDINADAKVKEGDEIVTSSKSAKYLSGILIGTVKSLETDSSKLTKSGTLTPAVDFSTLDTVLVITTLPEAEY